MKNNYLKVSVEALTIMVTVLMLSYFSVKLQGQKEEGGAITALIVNDTMTIAQLGEVNRIPNPVLKKVLGLSSKNDLQKTIQQFGFSKDQITDRFRKQLSLKAEYQTINIFIALVLNMVVIYLVLRLTTLFEKLLGASGLQILKKVFGVILLSIAIKLFLTNTGIVLPHAR